MSIIFGKQNEEHEYKFTIIIIYNDIESYIKQTIDSIVSQDIGFEKNVQVIIVNKTTDNCTNIINKEDNIVYSEAGSIREAFELRKGKYISIMDSNDLLESKCLSVVDKFFEFTYSQINYVAVPIVKFEKSIDKFKNNKQISQKNRIINLDDEPINFILNYKGIFYKTQIFDDIIINQKLDEIIEHTINMKLNKYNTCYGYICLKNTKYYLRESISNKGFKMRVNNKYINTVFKEIDDIILQNSKKLKKYEKEYVLLQIKLILLNLKEKNIGSDKYGYVINKIRKYIGLIGLDFIANETGILLSVLDKYCFLSEINENKPFKLGNNGYIQYNDLSINTLGIKIGNLSLNQNNINIELIFDNYNINNLSVCIKDQNGNLFYGDEKLVVDSSYSSYYGEIKISSPMSIKIELPITAARYNFYILDRNNNSFYRVEKITFIKNNKFLLKDKNLKLIKDNYFVRYTGKTLVVTNNKISTIKYNLWSYLYIMKKYKYNARFRLLNSRNKKYILINDRPEKASDNGEAVFKYINQYRKDLAKYTYYVISKNNEDYDRLSKFGKVVIKNSRKHKYLFLNSKLIMSSHTFNSFYYGFAKSKIKYYIDLLDYKFVWLQHGVTYNNVCKAANKYNTMADYVVVTTTREMEEISSDRYFYNADDLIKSGCPRYDYLNENSKNIITIIPTWRRYLSGKTLKNGFHEIKDGFKSSDYYINYSKILSDEKLRKLLFERGYKLKFILHPGMNGYEHNFEKFNNEVINIVPVKDLDYSKLFSESKLMITDYSSVFFDFSYLKKPLIYYQFDKDKFYGEHYLQGTFDFERDGFGDVINNPSEIINKIEYYLNNNFKLESEYEKRIESIFNYKDKNNCKRLIDYLEERKELP